MEKLGICNDFGIMPNKNFKAAGYDLYIPDVKGDKEKVFKEGIFKSFGLTEDRYDNISGMLTEHLVDKYKNKAVNNMLNLIHLYLAYTTVNDYNPDDILTVFMFIDNVLQYDEDKDRFGIKISNCEMFKINTGVRFALPEWTQGVTKNKSGKGMKGFQNMSVLVDEDYTGHVHIVMVNLHRNPRTVWIGEKMSQIIIEPVTPTKVVEYNRQEYDKVMSGSERGNDAFGSSSDFSK